VSRTAVWIGDQVTYTVELRCAPRIDILLDDLSAERLNIQGGELIGAEADHEETAAGVIRRMRYTVAAYGVDAPQLEIRQFPVRYYETRGLVTTTQTPAGEVNVPGATIAIRSTLPENLNLAVRQPAALRPAPPSVSFAERAGVLLIVLSAVPLAFSLLNVAGHVRRAWNSRMSHQLRKKQSGSLEQLKALETASTSGRIDAFDRLDAFIRDRLELATGINAHALTPVEVGREVARHRAALPREAIESVLDACQSARYAPDAPAQADWDRALRETEEIVAATR
jgi:hypothetical protein